MKFEFLPLVDFFWAWVFLSLVALAGYGYCFLAAKQGVSKPRLLAKTLLFSGFWIFLALVILNPQLQSARDNESILVYQNGINQEEISFWQDSLSVDQTIGISDYQDQEGKVFLLGEDFSADQLYPFLGAETQWILPRAQGILDQISWKGFVRKGERQRVYFSVYSPQPATWLKALIPNSDSVELDQGWNRDYLEFETAGLGRTEVALVLESDTLGVVRYFVGSALPKKYLIQMGFPSAETRTLVNWLREKGESVSEQVQLSKETFLASNAEKDSVQVMIIDPAQLNQKQVQDWVKEGIGNLLILQVKDAPEVTNQINRIFHTDFELEQASEELNLGLSSLPFRWKTKSSQISLMEERIAIQQVGESQIGISLLESSYSLVFQGNKSAYEGIWGEVLGAIEPDEQNAYRFSAPVFEGLTSEIELLGKDSIPEFWLLGLDTVWLTKDPIYSSLGKGKFAPDRVGWMDGEKEFSVYSYGMKEFSTVQTAKRLAEFSSEIKKSETEPSRPISPWVGLLGIFLFLAGMWLEPKITF